MNTITTVLLEQLLRFKKNGVLAVCYALLLEFLFIGYIGFAGLFTLEMLLPTFVTARLSLTIFFLYLLSGSLLLAFLGSVLDMRFSWNIQKNHPLIWIGSLWALALFLLSLIHFPLSSIPLIILALFTIGFLFWNIFFHE
ncbi:MAG: hypothetical protein PHH40_01790 [Candidatus Moranbacteria bacterium]|nr:hypothetical protein [Candidatus Moranbacteria bacterium]MDD3965048.1 hypothetical protein [Candidatus Moranbacteria bacterium]